MNIKEIFPYMVVLSMPHRSDRRETFFSAVQKLGLEIDLIYPKTAEELGIKPGRLAGLKSLTEAEIEAITRAKERGAPGLIIFEDDAVFHEHFNLLVSQIELPNDWTLFYFGSQHHETPVCVSRGIVRITKSYDTHALGIRDIAYDLLINLLRSRTRPVCNDQAIMGLQKQYPVYSAYPNFVWQKANFSDLVGTMRGSYKPTGEQRGWKSCDPPKIKHF